MFFPSQLDYGERVLILFFQRVTNLGMVLTCCGCFRERGKRVFGDRGEREDRGGQTYIIIEATLTSFLHGFEVDNDEQLYG